MLAYNLFLPIDPSIMKIFCAFIKYLKIHVQMLKFYIKKFEFKTLKTALGYKLQSIKINLQF